MAYREFLDTEEVRGSNPPAPTMVVARVTIGLGLKKPARLRIREPRSGRAARSGPGGACSEPRPTGRPFVNRQVIPPGCRQTIPHPRPCSPLDMMAVPT